jgi:hypothetical protein
LAPAWREAFDEEGATGQDSPKFASPLDAAARNLPGIGGGAAPDALSGNAGRHATRTQRELFPVLHRRV